jgi:nicotinamidase-related amidase
MKRVWRIILLLLAAIIIVVLFFAGNLMIFWVRAGKVSEGEPIADYGIRRSALLVIDIQEGTSGKISIDECYQEQADELIRNTNRLTVAAEAKDIPVIFIRNEIRNPFLNLLNNTLARGSEGAELDHRLDDSAGRVLTKNRKDAFSNPMLDSILVEHRVSHLYVAGLDAAHCVYSTIQAARNREYSVTVISDAVISCTEEELQEAVDSFLEQDLALISTREFIKDQAQ